MYHFEDKEYRNKKGFAYYKNIRKASLQLNLKTKKKLATYTVACDMGCCNDACAAASRAIGTRNGEQLT